MYRFTIIILIPIFLFCCAKDEVPLSNIISLELSQDSILADGSSTVDIIAYLPENTDMDKREVRFETNLGTFSNGEKEIVVSAFKELEIDTFIKAEATFITASSAGTATVDATVFGRRASRAIHINNSQAEQLLLSSSSFNVQANFLGEISVTGILRNEFGKNASSNISVIVLDEYPDGSQVSGAFRNESLTSNGDAIISFVYSPGFGLQDSTINLIGIVQDENNMNTSVRDTLTIFITP